MIHYSQISMRSAFSLIIACGSLLAAEPPPAPLDPAAIAAEPVRYLENDRLKLGIHLGAGGAITYLEDKQRKSGNMVNSFDWGRQIQLSFYSGPKPYIGPNGETPDPTWAGLGWNPGQMARGSSVVFLDPAVFADTPGANTGTVAEQYKATQVIGTRWLPLAHKGTITEADWVGGYFRGARWAKRHPIFDGLPAGGMMDARFYSNIISPLILSQDYTIYTGGVLMNPATAPFDRPSEAVCGSIRTNSEYVSGLHIGVWDFGAGRFIVNTLRIRENLGTDPAAERLLRNLLNYAARDLDKPVAELPADFEKQLKAIGYN